MFGFSDAVAQKLSGAKKLQLRRVLLFMVCPFDLTVLLLNQFGLYLYDWIEFTENPNFP